MKKLYILLFIVFSTSVFSQSSGLVGETWYLEKLVINGVDIFPPVNASLPHVTLNFSEENTIYTDVCNTGFGDVNFFEDTVFTLDFFSVTLSFCQDESNNLFDSIYLDSYFQENSSGQFTYSISSEDSVSQLIITNAQNNQAIYHNQNLSIPTLEKNNWSLYPNPTKEILHFKNENFQRSSVEIYDALGKLCISKTIDVDDLSVSIDKLIKGIYFVKVFNDSKTFSGKFIKE